MKYIVIGILFGEEKKDKFDRWEILVKLNSGLTVEGCGEILSWWKERMKDNYKRGKMND